MTDAPPTIFENDPQPDPAPGADWNSSPNVLQTSKMVIVGSGPIATTIDATKGITARINPRVLSIASSATPIINTDLYDMVSITALAVAITSFSTNLSGNFTDGQKLIIRILDNGTARAITWGASFVAKGVALPTTTVLSKLLSVGFIYDAVALTWGCVATAQET